MKYGFFDRFPRRIMVAADDMYMYIMLQENKHAWSK